MQQSVSSMQTNTPLTNGWMKVSFFILFLAFMSTTWTTQAANANPPGKMTFQGFLTDANTPPVPLGNTSPVNKTVTFTIYDNGTGGNVKWAESQVVTIDKGHFSVLLGEGSSVSGQPHDSDLSNVFIGADASDRWMGITVDGAEITPRIQFFAAPYAQLAKAANSLTSGATIGAITGNMNVTGSVDATGALEGGSLAISGDASLQRPGGTLLTIQTPDTDARIFAGAPSNQLLLNPFGGKVGIGTDAPTTTLHVGGTTRVNGALQVDGNNFIELGAGVAGKQGDAGKIAYGRWNNNVLGIVGGGTSGSDRIVQVYDRLGINTATPQAPLEVRGGTGLQNQNYGYLESLGNVGRATGAGGTYSIIAEHRVRAAEFNAVSDIRVKKVLRRGNNGEDLDAVMKLNVTDYQMIDQVASGSDIKRGFLAQEVEQIFPEAVTRSRQIVPDIYMLAERVSFDETHRNLQIRLSKSHGLKIGDKVRIICGEKDLELLVAETPSSNEFLVGPVDSAPDKVFVYGKEVTDFRTLNYDRIFTTGISAIQELAKQNADLKKRVYELESQRQKVAALERRVKELETLEKQMDQLKKAVDSLSRSSDDVEAFTSLNQVDSKRAQR